MSKQMYRKLHIDQRSNRSAEIQKWAAGILNAAKQEGYVHEEDLEAFILALRTLEELAVSFSVKYRNEVFIPVENTVLPLKEHKELRGVDNSWLKELDAAA